jgi:hypothetical protein
MLKILVAFHFLKNCSFFNEIAVVGNESLKEIVNTTFTPPPKKKKKDDKSEEVINVE